MKKLFTTGIFISLTVFVFAQSPCGDLYLWSKTLYKSPTALYTLPPAGYQPIFINHINRHGARHLTKAVDSTYAFAILMKAGSLHGLTMKGEQLKKMVVRLQELEQASIGFISYEGAQELQGIAR